MRKELMAAVVGAQTGGAVTVSVLLGPRALLVGRRNAGSPSSHPKWTYLTKGSRFCAGCRDMGGHCEL